MNKKQPPMPIAASARSPSRHDHRRTRKLHHALPLAIAAIVAVSGLAATIHLLWPSWSGRPGAIDPDRLPVVIGEVLFNVPTDAVRKKVQRHAGQQERVDLIFAYPDLTPPPPPVRQDIAAAEAPADAHRLFLSIAAHGGALSPEERLRTIYPRYLDPTTSSARDGLTGVAFRPTSPYRNEDLFTGENGFAARCSRDAATAGMCLHDLRIDGADLTFRFPRAWLVSWRDVADHLDRLVARLRGVPER